MKWNSRDWIFVTGKAFAGKTYWIRAHINAVVASREVRIYDFTNEYIDLMKKPNVGIWRVMRGTQDEVENFVGQAYNQGNLTVIMSESDNYLRMNSQVLLAFVTTGRNRGINAIIDAKRPMSVRPEYRGRFNHLILFQTTLPDDIEYLESWTGTGKGSLNVLKTLKQGEFIHANTDTQEISPVSRL